MSNSPLVARLRAARRQTKVLLQHPSNRGYRMRTAWGFGRYLVNGPRGRATTVKFAQHSLVLARRGGDSSARPVFARLPDWPEMVIWQQFLRDGELFVDVGANVGLYTLLALECGCSVVALEPASDMVRRVNEHLLLNSIDPSRVEVHQVAAMGEPGMVDLSGPDPNRRSVVPGQGTVVAVRLDSLVGDRRVRGLKIDVEGNERRVLEGATALLSQPSLEMLQLEWNNTSEAALGEDREAVAVLLRRYGFQLFRPLAEGGAIRYDGVVPGYGADVFAARGGAVDVLNGHRRTA